MMKRCPKCGKSNSVNAWLCDCGYEFQSADCDFIGPTKAPVLQKLAHLKKNKPAAVAALLLLLLLYLTIYPTFWKSALGRTIRFASLEPLATQEVNDAAETIISKNLADELHDFCKKLIMEFPPTEHGQRLSLGVDIPRKFYSIFYGQKPEVSILSELRNSTPRGIILGTRLLAVVVYETPSYTAPSGYFFTRRIDDFTYVVAIIK